MRRPEKGVYFIKVRVKRLRLPLQPFLDLAVVLGDARLPAVLPRPVRQGALRYVAMLFFNRDEESVVVARRAHVEIQAEDVFTSSQLLSVKPGRNSLFHRY